MRNYFIVFSILALTGCRTLMDPTFMPAGYAYHNDYYKSPPGPESRSIGYPYTPAANAAVINLWNIVASQLVDRMESELGLAAQPVHVDTQGHKGAFTAAFDYALLEELRRRGYTLATHTANVMTLRPEAYLPEEEQLLGNITYNDDKPQTKPALQPLNQTRNFLVRVSALRNGVLLGAVEDYYDLPAYGYARGRGWDGNIRAQKAEQSASPAPSDVPQASPEPEDILAPALLDEISGEPLPDVR